MTESFLKFLGWQPLLGRSGWEGREKGWMGGGHLAEKKKHLKIFDSTCSTIIIPSRVLQAGHERRRLAEKVVNIFGWRGLGQVRMGGGRRLAE